MKKLSLLFIGVLLLGVGCIRVKTGGSGDGGVFFSAEGGAAWEHKVFVRQEKKRAITIAGEGVTALAFDPTNASVMYLGTEGSGVYVTENAGESWTLFFPYGGRTTALAINPKNREALFVALGDRVLRTADRGKQWEIAYLEPRSKVLVTNLVVDNYDGQKVYLTLSNGDLMRSADGGKSWSMLYHTNSPIIDILVHPKDTRVITVATQYDSLFRSTNLGKTWEPLRPLLEKYNESNRAQALLSDTNNPRHLLYFSYFGLLQSRDGGKTWDEVKLLASPNTAPVTAAVIAPSKPTTLYYTTATALYASRDAGKTWTTYPLPTAKRPSALLVDSKEPSRIYLGVTKQKK